MSTRIEKDLEELGVNIFVNEYGSLRSVYNRLYAIIHVYYSTRRQLVATGDALPLEKMLQMRKEMTMRLERVHALTTDEQFPQEDFEAFAREKLEKMHLAIGLLETAGLMGEQSSYSQTIMDYMQSCCEFASKFITVLSDPGNQDLQALKNNLTTLLEQIDMAIKRTQSPDHRRATVPLNESLVRGHTRITVPLNECLSVPPVPGASRASTEAYPNLDPSHSYIHQEHQHTARDNDAITNVNEALTMLEKIDLFRSKSREMEANIHAPTTASPTSEITDDKGVTPF
jgi:hypothetical protein